MKLEKRFRVLSAALALVMLFTACGNTVDTPNTEVNSTEESQVTIEQEETNVLTTPSEGTEQEEEPVVEVLPTPDELEQQEWQNYMMPNVEHYLNVRVELTPIPELIELATQTASLRMHYVVSVGEDDEKKYYDVMEHWGGIQTDE